MKIFSKSIVAALILVLAESTLAHHSVLPFDRDTFTVLEGVISELRWRNPHVKIKLIVRNDAGLEEVWDLESGAANSIARKGVSKDDINVGDRIRVAGWPSKFGRKELFVINLLLPNGQETITMNDDFPLLWTVKPAESGIGLAAANLERTIFRTWDFAEIYKPREPFVFTAAAQAARAKWDPFTDSSVHSKLDRALRIVRVFMETIDEPTREGVPAANPVDNVGDLILAAEIEILAIVETS